MKETDPELPTPRLVVASERNPGKSECTVVKCSPLNEVQIRRNSRGIMYRVIPQMVLTERSVRVALSLVEGKRFVASRTQEILIDVDYRIENTKIKISLAKFQREKEFYVTVQAPEHEVLEEAQLLSTDKYY
ncbi:MAG: hypothetical protein AAB675_03395 [Patescibacteria group bacterium]